jgi:molybdate transport repressor ModE-like protein
MNAPLPLADAIGHLELRQLRYLATVAESGSISGAARVLKIAQPAVSRTIQCLEECLGVQLFERRARGVATTAYGTALVRHFRLIEANLRHAADDIGALQGRPSAQIRIGVGPVEASALMAEALSRFMRRQPDTKVVIREGFYAMLEPALLDGDLDLIVGGGGRSAEAAPAAELRTEVLGQVRPAIVVRRQHPLARKTRCTVTDLHNADWILPHGTGAPYTAFIDAFARNGLPPPTGRVHAATTSWTALGLVLRNDLVALLPHQLIRRDLETGALKTLEIGEDFYAFPAYLVTREDSPLQGAARQLLAEIRTVCRELSGTLR